MIRSTLKIAFLASAGVMAVSCASPFNGPQHAVTVAEQHPISVDSQVVTLTIDAVSGFSDLSDIDKARVRAFANAYLVNGHGPITVTAPSGTSTDSDSQEASSDIRTALHEAGVPWSSINSATYRTGDTPGGSQLVMSYTHYVATASACGIWSSELSSRYRNVRSPNHGCATQNNIAAMIADPRDLVEPAGSSDRDATNIVRAIRAYREGTDTASEVGDIEVQASGQ